MKSLPRSTRGCRAPRPGAPAALVASLALAAFAHAAPAVDLHLSDAFVRAMAKNKSLAVRVLDPAIAAAQVRIERGAFDRTLTMDVSRQNNQTPTSTLLQGATLAEQDTQAADIGINARTTEGAQVSTKLQSQRSETNSSFATLNPAYTSNLILTMTQPLARSGGQRVNTANLRAARVAQRAAAERLRGEVQNTIATVERSYLDLIFAREDLEVKEVSLRGALALVELHTRRRQIGSSSRVQIVEADSTAQLRRSDAMLARRAVAEAQDVLRRELSWKEIDPATQIVPADAQALSHEAVTRHAPGTLDEELVGAFRHRPDYRAALLDLKARGIQLAFARNQTRPEIDLVTSYQLNGLGATLGDSVNEVFDKDFTTWSVGLAVQLPLDNQVARGTRDQRALQEKQALLSVKAIEDQTEQDVTTAQRRVLTDRERLVVAREAADLAAEKLAQEEERFRAGLVANFDLLRFQEDLATARENLVRTEVDLARSWVDLDLATGELLERRGIRWDMRTSAGAPGVPVRSVP